jgi:hypothetical protein
MFCESYRQPLTDAALGGASLPLRLEQHLAACEDCRSAFDRELALARSIDAALEARVNVRVPPSLVARVRAGVPASRGRMAWCREVPALLGALAILAVMAWSASVRSSAPARPGGQAPVARRAEAPLRPEASRPAASNRARPARRTGALARVAPRAARPEVLVAPEERAGFERFVARLRTPSRESWAVHVEGAAGLEIAPLEIAAMDLRQLAIEPLESGDSN